MIKCTVQYLNYPLPVAGFSVITKQAWKTILSEGTKCTGVAERSKL